MEFKVKEQALSCHDSEMKAIMLFAIYAVLRPCGKIYFIKFYILSFSRKFAWILEKRN